MFTFPIFSNILIIKINILYSFHRLLHEAFTFCNLTCFTCFNDIKYIVINCIFLSGMPESL